MPKIHSEVTIHQPTNARRVFSKKKKDFRDFNPLAALATRRGSTPQVAAELSKPPTRTEAVWAFADDPSSSTGAQLFSVVVLLTIGVSCTAFCLETLPSFHKKNEDTWFLIETICVIVFTVEFVLRVFSCPEFWKFARSPLNMIDFIAIMPYYLELGMQEIGGGSAVGGQSAIFRVVRLIRVFRVLKVSRYLAWVKVFAHAMLESAQPLGMLVFVMSIGCIFFSSAIFFAERGEWSEEMDQYLDVNGDISKFQSIPHAFWWCIITMTTVGYGDAVPLTVGGKVIASMTSLSGILVLAIPITVISTKFNEEYGRVRKEEKALRCRLAMLQRHFRRNRTGLDAINDEIDDMVRRSYASFLQEVDQIVSVGREELAENLRTVARTVYNKHREALRLAVRARRKSQQEETKEEPAKRLSFQRVTEESDSDTEVQKFKKGEEQEVVIPAPPPSSEKKRLKPLDARDSIRKLPIQDFPKFRPDFPLFARQGTELEIRESPMSMLSDDVGEKE